MKASDEIEAKCTMTILVRRESVVIDNPLHIPRVGEDVAFVVRRTSYRGVVTNVNHSFHEQMHYIEVVAL